MQKLINSEEANAVGGNGDAEVLSKETCNDLANGDDVSDEPPKKKYKRYRPKESRKERFMTAHSLLLSRVCARKKPGEKDILYLR